MWRVLLLGNKSRDINIDRELSWSQPTMPGTQVPMTWRKLTKRTVLMEYSLSYEGSVAVFLQFSSPSLYLIVTSLQAQDYVTLTWWTETHVISSADNWSLGCLEITLHKKLSAKFCWWDQPHALRPQTTAQWRPASSTTHCTLSRWLPYTTHEAMALGSFIRWEGSPYTLGSVPVPPSVAFGCLVSPALLCFVPIRFTIKAGRLNYRCILREGAELRFVYMIYWEHALLLENDIATSQSCVAVGSCSTAWRPSYINQEERTLLLLRKGGDRKLA